MTKVRLFLNLAIALVGVPLAQSQVTVTAQTGYTEVGASPSKVVPSPMALDATQFCSGGTYLDGTCTSQDMCYAIEAAIASSLNVSGDIDARGFYGTQKCSAANATTMLYGGITAGGTQNGRLFLGHILLGIDGPSAGYFTDGNGSSYGTPAIILPNQFGGIFGVSANATQIGVCLGTNNPLTGCTTSFPVRSFPISNTSVSGNTMTLTITTASFVCSGTGQNVWSTNGGELVSIIGSSTTNNNLGMLAVESGSCTTSSINLNVPTGTNSCSTSCGTLYFHTPLIGWGTGNSGTAYVPVQAATGVQSFKQKLQHLSMNLNGNHGLYGICGVQNVNGGEQTGIDDVELDYVADCGFDIGQGSSEGGPYTNLRVLNLGSVADGVPAMVGIYHASADRGIDNWSVIAEYSGSGQQPNTCVVEDGTAQATAQTRLSGGHTEWCADSVEVSTNFSSYGIEVDSMLGPPSAHSGTNLIHLGSYGTSTEAATFRQISQGTGSTNSLKDDNNSVICTDLGLGDYETDMSGLPALTTCKNLTGTAQQFLGSGAKGVFVAGGTTFTASGCSATSLTGGALSGSYKSGTTGTCAVTITTGVIAPNGYACSASDLNNTNLQHQTAATTRTATISGTTTSGDTVVFSCTPF